VVGRVVGMGVRPEHIKGARKPAGFSIRNFAIGVGVAMGMAALAVGLVRRQRSRAAA